MQKEVFVDCREKDLGEEAIAYGAAGVIGKTSADIKSIGKYKTVKIIPGDTIEKIYNKISKVRGVNYVVIETADWRVIPWENAINATKHFSKKIATKVRTVDEARLAFSTLEKGVDAVIVDEKSDIEGICELLKEKLQRIELVDAKITKVEPIGNIERVCIDTTRRLYNLEGMLVGSQAEGLFLVESETYKTPYIEPRPFRVNAGSLGLYILVPGGRTKYLSELKGGDEVCIVDKDGNMRVVNIDRVKEESRPGAHIEAEYEGRIFKTNVQNAETIRLVGNKSILLADLLFHGLYLEKDIKVKLRLGEKARHLGMTVKYEHIEER